MRFVQQKRELRSSFRQRADLFQAHNSAFQVERLNENLISFLKSQVVKQDMKPKAHQISGQITWAAFKASGHEPRLEKVIQSCPHIRWVYPKMVDHHLVFIASQKFETGAWGIDEPVGGDLVKPEDVQGFLIPGVAFDRQGGRLGRGKGFYDRALAGSRGLHIGVGFSFQIYEGTLPTESFDIKMDGIISEQGLWAVNSKTGAMAPRSGFSPVGRLERA
jgi:5-formyltetrahydrofolate cyclo-ligase